VDATIFTYSGTSLEQGHRLAIINNHSFAVGDEGDVRTSSGRVHLRVISIGADTVVIEVNGTRREIKITDK
jgi:preprotein translocase subunit YajC